MGWKKCQQKLLDKSILHGEHVPSFEKNDCASMIVEPPKLMCTNTTKVETDQAFRIEVLNKKTNIIMVY